MIRVWARRQGAAALAVLAGTALWRGLLLRASYFNQDDYYLTTRAYHRSGLSWDFLFAATAGHIQPAQQLTYWLVAHHAAFDWGRVAAGILVVEVLTVAAMWHLLTRLLPGRWVRVPLLAVFAWSPITLVTTLWWSAAMGLWPPLLFLVLAGLFFVRAQDRAREANLRVWPDLVCCVCAVVLGLAWHERGILTLALLAGLAIARSPRTGWRRLTDAATRWWPLWWPLIALGAGYLVLHSSLTSVAAQQASFESRLSIVRAFVLRNTVPGMASGPWRADVLGGAVVPARWVEVLAAILAAAVAGLLVWRGGRARWAALAMLAGYVGGDVLLLLLGRSGFGEIIGLDPRYTADVVAAAVIFAAVALEGTGPFGPRPRGLPVLALGATLLYLAGSVVTTIRLAPVFENHDDRSFITRLRADLAKDPEQVLLDRLAPPGILLPLLGKEAMLSAVLAPLPEHPAFDEPGPKLRSIADDGHLVAVTVVPVATGVPGHDGACGHAVRAGETTIDLTTPLSGRNVVRVEAFMNKAADYTVHVGTWTGAVHVVPGPQVLWLVVPDDAGDYGSISLSGTGPGTLCVVGVVAGPAVDVP